MGPRRTVILALLIAIAVICAGTVEWANAVWKIPGPPARQGNQTVILIPAHMRVHAIAEKLEGAGVLRHAFIFEFDLRVRGLASGVKAGEYAVPSHAAMADIAAILIAGKSIEHKLTAAEGLTSQMITALVAADPALMGATGPVPPEGTLLPETYLFTHGMTRAGLLARMRSAQAKLLAKLWPARAPELPYATPSEAVVLASIVEKESALPEERRHIAAVFLNRLKRGMKLQSDPTIIYGLTKGYPLGRGILASEIAAATTYNTYVIGALPPTPICNPGKDLIQAVLEPEQSEDLYFVADGHGGHVFAATIAAHEKNVAAWRAAQRSEAVSPMPAAR